MGSRCIRGRWTTRRTGGLERGSRARLRGRNEGRGELQARR